MGIQKLLASFVLNQQNMRMLHWNMTGTDFDPVHTLLGDYVDHILGDIDTIAELCMQLGETPVSIAEAVRIMQGSGIKYIPGDSSFTPIEAFEGVEFIFESFLDEIEECYDDDLPHDVQSELENIEQYYRKECRYKNKKRLS